MQWKLTHRDEHECIENEGGKTLSYNPNLGMQIIEQDGYAFKDLDNNGKLDPFEDWRLPLTMRVKDFSTRYHLWQEADCLFYKKGKIVLPEAFCEEMQEYPCKDVFESLSEEDQIYLKENYIIAMLLLMLDNDYEAGKADYLLALIIQSMDLGLLENIIYSIIEALKKYQRNRERSCPQGI